MSVSGEVRHPSLLLLPALIVLTLVVSLSLPVGIAPHGAVALAPPLPQHARAGSTSTPLAGSSERADSRPEAPLERDPSRPSSLYSASITTTDPGAWNNSGIDMTIVVPSGNFVPRQNFTFLVGEPFNSTTSIAIGIVGWENGSAPEWQAEYQVWNLSGRPGLLTVIDPTPIAVGSTVDLLFQAANGSANGTSWWSALDNGFPIHGAGGNGTLFLAANTSVGYDPTGFPFPCPEFVVSSPVAGPPMTLHVPNALQWIEDVYGAVPIDNVPYNGIWSGPSSGWNLVGDNQKSGLIDGEIWMGPGIPASPPTGSWLWGVGGPSFQPIANVTSDVAGVYPNSGVGFDLNFSQGGLSSAVGPDAGSYLVTAWEVVEPGLSVGVGIWVNAPGYRIVPYFVVNTSGDLDFTSGWDNPYYGGPELIVRAFAQPTGWWNFTVNGVQIIGAFNEALGANLSVLSVAAGSGPYLTVSTSNWTVPPQPTALDLDAGLLVNVSGSWWLPTSALVGPLITGCPSCGPSYVQGEVQDPFLAPGQLVVVAGGPTAAVGDFVWQGTALPSSSVAVEPLPSPVGSFANLTLEVWVNSSGVPLANAVASLAAPGVNVLPPSYPAAGVALFHLEVQEVYATQTVSLTAEGAAVGYAPASTSEPLNLTFGTLELQAQLAGPAPVSGGATSLMVWANGSQGAGPRTVAVLDASSSLGGHVVVTGFDASSGGFGLAYQAPNVSLDTDDLVAIDVASPGFWLAATDVPVPLTPLTLTLAVHLLTSPVLSGDPLGAVAFVNASHGGPLPISALAAVFGTITTPLPVPFQAVAPGVYLFNVSAPPVRTNQTLPLLVQVDASGYAAGTVTLNVAVEVHPLAIAASVLALGTQYAIVVDVTTYGAPLDGASVAASASSGTVSPLLLQTDPSGVAQFTFVPPSGGSGTYRVQIDAVDAGFEARNTTVSILVVGTPNPFGLLAQGWLVLAPLLVLAAFAVLWIVGRARAGPPRPPLKTPSGTPPSTKKEEDKRSETPVATSSVAAAPWSAVDLKEIMPPPDPRRAREEPVDEVATASTAERPDQGKPDDTTVGPEGSPKETPAAKSEPTATGKGAAKAPRRLRSRPRSPGT